jgi:hypothetical protein
VTSPFLLRTVDPPLESAEGRTVTAIRRVGKRIAIGVGPQERRGPEAHATAGWEAGGTGSSGASDSSIWLVIALDDCGAAALEGEGGEGGREAKSGGV